MKALSAAKIEKMSAADYLTYLTDMNAGMDYRLAMEENSAKAEKKGIEKGIEKLLINNILSVEQIADAYNVTIDYVLQINKRLVKSMV